MSLSDLIGDANTVLYGDYYANLRLRNVPKSVLPSVLTTTIVESDCYVLESIGQVNQKEKPKFIFLEDESLIPQISSFYQSTFIKPSPVDPTSSHHEAYRKLTRFNSSNDSFDPLLYPEHSFRMTNPSKDDVLDYLNKLNSSSPLSVNSILSDDEDNELQEEPKSVEGEAKPLKLKRNRRKLEKSLPKPRRRKDTSNDNGLKALSEQPKPTKEKSKPLKLNSRRRIFQESSSNTRKVRGENYCRYKLRCPLVGCEFKFDNNARLMAHLRTKHPVEEVLNVNRVITNKENNPSLKNIVLNCQKAQSEETTNQSRNKANRKPLTNNNMLNIFGNIQKSLNVPLQSVDVLVTKVDHQPSKLLNRKTPRSETPQNTQPQEKRFRRPKKVQKYKSY